MNLVQTIEPQSYLQSLLVKQASPESQRWLQQKTEKLRSVFSEKELYLTLSLLPRFFGKERLNLNHAQLQQANLVRTGFSPVDFSVVQAARVAVALFIPAHDKQRYLNILNLLFSTGEVNELVALYSALPLLPHPELLKTRAAEGIRNSMTVVFDAVALNNPYPADYLDDDAWNQMVLKAVFMERPLDNIYGIDNRANNRLARMLSDYAHERWAASRPVTPELWRSVGPFLDDYLLNDIKRLLNQGNETEQQAAALAIKGSSFLKAQELLSAKPELKNSAEKGEFNWKTISRSAYG